MDDSNRARIAGFDQAMVINDGDPPEDDSRVGFAFRWDAPEVLAGGVRSKKSDTFSFAMVMIEVRHRSTVCRVSTHCFFISM